MTDGMAAPRLWPEPVGIQDKLPSLDISVRAPRAKVRLGISYVKRIMMHIPLTPAMYNLRSVVYPAKLEV